MQKDGLVNKLAARIVDESKLRLSGTQGVPRAHQDFEWIKYGPEYMDWALLVNAWLCVENSSNGTGKELVVYSSDERFPQSSKVSF